MSVLVDATHRWLSPVVLARMPLRAPPLHGLAAPRLGTALLAFVICSAFPAEGKATGKKSSSSSQPTGKAFSTVVIDAGHGGHDRGGLPGQKVLEKTMALDVAKRLQELLADAGFTTVMTRTDDVFVSLGERVAVADAHPGAIFLSIHFNAAPREGAYGIETFYAGKGSKPIAVSVHKSLLPIATLNRGVKQAGFYVLRKHKLPAVLIECGFLTNPRDAALAEKETYRQNLAERIAVAIFQYHADL
jgi:N-acetylmuramoyl-L-alanine amidase